MKFLIRHAMITLWHSHSFFIPYTDRSGNQAIRWLS